MDDGFDAIVLAGGAARRLGGADKPMLEVGGTPMLIRVLDAVSGARVRVVVGPPRLLPADVLQCRETPPGGGPVAALAAGVPHTSATTIVVLAADLPGIAPAIGPLRTGKQSKAADVALLSTGGRTNYLAGAWRRAALVAALARLDPRDAPMRALVAHVTVTTVQDGGNWGQDYDTWADLGRSGPRHGTTPRWEQAMTNQLDTWVSDLSAGLGLDPASTDVTLLLDVARDAAHGVARPAAPLTTFLVGLAAGRRGGTPQAVADAAAVAQRLVAERGDSAQPTSSGSA